MKTIDAETGTVRAALLAIANEHHGVLNPGDVIAAARDQENPLHRYFEWDDGAAADAYRLIQAGSLVRRVRLTILRGDATSRSVHVSTTRAFQSRPSMRRSDGGYETIDAILSDADKRTELIAQVVRELSAYRKRYAELIELQPVWIAVDDVVSDLSPSPSVSPDDGDSAHGAAV